MKQLNLLAGALLILGLTACSDEIGVEVERPVSGEEVAFGTSLKNFSMPGTKTIYGVPDGQDVEGYEALTINWVKGDKVRVYSPQATTGFQYADYVIDEATEGGSAHYFLVKDSHNDTGVRWGDVNTPHHFYAFYPTNINRNNYTPIKGLGDGQTANNMTVEAEIPVAQEHGEPVEAGESDRNIGNITLPAHWKLIRPDMTYAIMAGHGTWDPQTNPDKNVTINFKPIVTVVDVVVNGPTTGNSISIYRVSINSKKTPIVGKFTAKFAENGDVTFGGMPETVAENNNMATINCQYDGVPTKLGPGEKLTLKFFLLPRAIDASELSVTVQVDAGRVLTKSLIPGLGEDQVTNDNPLAQGQIVRVWTPNLTVPESSNWMSSIPDNALFSQLSLPGSKHSYTGDLYKQAVNGGGIDEENGIMQYYQSLYVTDNKDNDPTQFDMGVRAFDLKIYNNDGTNHVYAGGNPVGTLTLSNVLSNLQGKMVDAAAGEACVVMLNYVSPPDVSIWLSRIESELESWQSSNGSLVRIDPAKTTMKDMRGKIAVIINVPDNTTGRKLTYVNYIYGFSSSVQNMKIQNLTLNDGQSVLMQNLYQVNNPNLKSGGNYVYQHAGLVPYYATQLVQRDNANDSIYDLIHMKDCLMRDLFNELRKETNASLCINDLAGFCVTRNDESTGYAEYGTYRCERYLNWGVKYRWVVSGSTQKAYQYNKIVFPPQGSVDYDYTDNPEANSGNVDKTWFRITGTDIGQGGNTVTFAEHFNITALDAVYHMVEDGRVPLGIVFMNFAGLDEVLINGNTHYVHGASLPSTVMSNNFMFSLKTGTTTTEPSTKASNTKVGDGWD